MERSQSPVVQCVPAVPMKQEPPRRCTGERGAVDPVQLGAVAGMFGSSLGLLIGDAYRAFRGLPRPVATPTTRAAVIGACAVGGAAASGIAQALIR